MLPGPIARAMTLDPLTALQTAARPAPRASATPLRLLIAGAGGALGRATVEEALAGGRYASVGVLTRAPLQPGLRGLKAVPWTEGGALPPADVAIVVFDRGRDYYGRDEAWHLPEPHDLLPLARRLHAAGVHTLAVLCPVSPSLLPQALQQGLADLDEQAVAALGFERLLFVRPTQDAPVATLSRWPERLARWMLSQLRYMIPQREQPVRAAAVVDFVFEVLQQWREAAPGTRVAGAPVLWRAAQAGGSEGVVREWLGNPRSG